MSRVSAFVCHAATRAHQVATRAHQVATRAHQVATRAHHVATVQVRCVFGSKGTGAGCFNEPKFVVSAPFPGTGIRGVLGVLYLGQCRRIDVIVVVPWAVAALAHNSCGVDYGIADGVGGSQGVGSARGAV